MHLKLATAPADVLLSASAADLSLRNSYSELSTHGVPRSSGVAAQEVAQTIIMARLGLCIAATSYAQNSFYIQTAS